MLRQKSVNLSKLNNAVLFGKINFVPFMLVFFVGDKKESVLRREKVELKPIIFDIIVTITIIVIVITIILIVYHHRDAQISKQSEFGLNSLAAEH